MFGNIFYRDIVSESIADFICHSPGYLIPEIPEFIADRLQREPGIYAELSVFCIIVIEELCQINVRSDGYRLILPCHILAKAPGFSDVFIHIAPKCRTDIDFSHVSYPHSSHRRSNRRY